MRTPRSSVFRAGLALALALVSTAIALADGELDLGFSPPPELGSNYLSLTLANDQAYVYGFQQDVRRLREDGSLDPDWRLTVPVGSFVSSVRGLPAGGLAVLDMSSLFTDYGDGTYIRTRGVGFGFGGLIPLFPQADGSLTVLQQQTAVKVLADGTIDAKFRIKPRLEAVNTSTSSGSGSLSITGGQDSQGRYVIIGNLHVASPVERFGLLRLLPDGLVDTGWNPGPALGLHVTPGGILNEHVIAVTVLPDDSALVVLENELAWIDAGGKVTKRVPNLASHREFFLPPLVQPDGRVILSGNFFKWSDTGVSGLVRLSPDGVLDPTFNVQMDEALLQSMALDERGRLWLAGYFHTVNGVARPSVARVFAYAPDPTNSVAPTLTLTAAQPHIATNEALYLTARVDGVPSPDLQWFRNGLPLAGATNRGLRLNITNASDVGHFSLVASNSLGTQELNFPAVSLAQRSPRPGTEDAGFNRGLTNFSKITHLLPLADGRVLVGSGDRNLDQSLESALVGRLLPSGGLDSSFGQEGVVLGRGRVETLIPLLDGGMLVAGEFTELAGQPAYGLAELDRDGKRVVRAFPSLDIPHVSTALPLPDGRLIIAGRFTKVDNGPAYRLARLNSDLTLDPSFHAQLLDWQFVDALALDPHGRVLIVGARVYANATVTNPALVGLQRLLENGSPDPVFHARTNGLRSIFLEADGKMLVGMPPARLDEDGNALTLFEDDVYPFAVWGHQVGAPFEPNHLMARTGDGGVVYQAWRDSFGNNPIELWRWKPTGERDYRFQSQFSGIRYVTAITALPDDSLLLGTLFYGTVDAPGTPEQNRRLHRIPRDSDFSLRTKDVSARQFHVALETQPGLTYEVYQREQLTGGTATKLGEYSGDGYVVDLQTPATGDATYLELRRH